MDKEVEKLCHLFLLNNEKLCFTYNAAQIRCIPLQTCHPTLSRLFELIEQLERIQMNYIRRFLMSHGMTNISNITHYNNIQPIPLENKNPIEIYELILNLEELLLNNAIDLMKLANEKGEIDLVVYFQNEVILRLRKIISKRKGQLANFQNRDDKTSIDSNVTMIEVLSILRDIRGLDKKLEYELEKRCFTSVIDREKQEEMMNCYDSYTKY